MDKKDLKPIIEELQGFQKHELSLVGLTPRTTFNGTQEDHDEYHRKKAELYGLAVEQLTRPQDSQYANSESRLSDEEIVFGELEDGTCVITVKGKNMHNQTYLKQEIISSKAVFEALKTLKTISPSPSLVEALEKAVSLIKTQYFINFPDTDESEFESFRKIDPHMIVIDKALKQQNDD